MLSNKIVLITGANRGLGRELSLNLADAGAILLLGCRRYDKGLHIKEMIDNTGGCAEVLNLDVTDMNHILGVTDKIKLDYKRLDILINNAGIFSEQSDCNLEALTNDVIMEMVNVNLLGPLLLTKALLPLLKKSEAGRILNITSDLADFANMDGENTLYRMTKVALNAFTLNLGIELINTPIRVYGIDPGWMKTDMGGEDAPQSPVEVADWINYVLHLKEDIPSGTIFYEKGIATWWNKKWVAKNRNCHE